MTFVFTFILIFIAFVVFFAALKRMRYSDNPGKFIVWIVVAIVVIILSILYLLFAEIVWELFSQI